MRSRWEDMGFLGEMHLTRIREPVRGASSVELGERRVDEACFCLPGFLRVRTCSSRARRQPVSAVRPRVRVLCMSSKVV